MYRYTSGTHDAGGTPGSYKNHYVPQVQSDKLTRQQRQAAAERRSSTDIYSTSSASPASSAHLSPAVGHQPQQQVWVQRRSELATAVFTPSPVRRLSIGQVSRSVNYTLTTSWALSRNSPRVAGGYI